MPDIEVKPRSKWNLKSNRRRIATVIYVIEHKYVRFKAPWMKNGEGGKEMYCFLKYYEPHH